MKRLLLPVFLLSSTSLVFASPTTYTIDFEQYPGYTQIDNQYSAEHVTFDNALQLVAPTYNYFDYPPHSGSGVITNDPSDPIQVNFTGIVYGVSGWYADPNGVTVTAYDGSGGVLDTFSGAPVIGSNNEFTIASGSPIAYFTISDDAGNADGETVDDITYTVTPEPGSIFLLGSGALVLAGFLRRRFAR